MMTTTRAGRVPSAWPTSRRFERLGWHCRCDPPATQMSYPRDLVGDGGRPPRTSLPWECARGPAMRSRPRSLATMSYDELLVAHVRRELGIGHLLLEAQESRMDHPT